MNAALILKRYLKRQILYSIRTLQIKKYRLKLIQPSQIVDNRLKKFKKSFAPGRTLSYIAALTPSDFEVSILDETLEDIDFDEIVDLIGLTSLINQLPRAIQIAKEYKRREVKVIIGGVAASALRHEVSTYFDSIIVGEVENMWNNILNDFKNGHLQKIYISNEKPTLEEIPYPKFELLPLERYLRPRLGFSRSKWPRIPIETSRGCPHNCSFCCVSSYFGKQMRFRPIKEIIQEIERFPGAFIIFTDDNIAANPKRAKELFRELVPLKIRWFGQFTMLAGNDEELIQLAGESGCLLAFLGVESILQESLASVRKNFNVVENYPRVFKVFDDAGILVNPSIIFGFDEDNLQLIDETIDLLIGQKIPLMVQWILTPVPGSELYSQLEQDKRILHKDYSKYDGTHVVFKPKQMTAYELEEKFWETFQRFYSISSTITRLSKHLDSFLFLLERNLFYRNMVRNKVHPYSGGI